MKLKQAFTVVEVLVVIGIIAILTVIIFPSISNIRAKNRDTERVADLASLQLGLSLYYNKSGEYPKTQDNFESLGSQYFPSDSLIPPNSDPDYGYKYVSLKKGTSGKCIYYHLGVKLELPSAQIDTNNTFSTAEYDKISNGYSRCDDTTDSGIPSSSEDGTFYSVHP
jgi:prepilin-type N-terminal cleavage/methylation domain-containing protein